MEDFKPKDAKGFEHLLGEYTKEKSYKQFKTLGAKRYAYSYYKDYEDYENNKVWNKDKHQYDPYIVITVAGVNKEKGSRSLTNIDDFKHGRFFDFDDCGKTIAYYNNNQIEVTMPDGYVAKQKYGICLMPTTYNLDLHDYRDVLDKLQEVIML